MKLVAVLQFYSELTITTSYVMYIHRTTQTTSSTCRIKSVRT